MWWTEVLPAWSVMTFCIFLPGFACGRLKYFRNNRKEQRSTYSQHHWYLFQRDKRVSGCNSELYPKGLENIN